MYNKLVGAILLGSAGIVLAVGVVGSQMVNEIARNTGQAADASWARSYNRINPHWIVIVAATALAVSGIGFIIRKSKADHDDPRQ